MTVCAIMQPTYLPWMGYFDLVDQADIFVLLDDVQLAKRSWQVRNRVRRTDGEALMLSIPVRKTAERDALLLGKAEVNDSTGWRRKHLASLENAYAAAPFGDSALAIWRDVLALDTTRLADLHIAAIERVISVIGAEARLVRSSSVGASGSKDDRLRNICTAMGADAYLSALGSAAYISADNPEGAFAGSGIDLTYQHYEHPAYEQAGREFMPYLGVIDLLAHVGPDRALSVIRSGRRPAYSPQEAQTMVSAA